MSLASDFRNATAAEFIGDLTCILRSVWLNDGLVVLVSGMNLVPNLISMNLGMFNATENTMTGTM